MTAHTWRDWSCTVRVVVGQDDSIRDPIVEDAVATVRALMGEVERAVSRFRHDSELERVNDAAPGLVPVGPLTLSLVEVALGAARRTDGAVDPTIGAHLLASGYDTDLDAGLEAGLDAGLDAGRGRLAGEWPAGPAADWTRVVVDHDLGRVGVPRGVRLDLGATAKAWTADEAAHRLADRVQHPVLVEIGGDLAVAGAAEQPWRVRVAESESAAGDLIGLTHGGLATSSTTVRRWRSTVGPAHHVLDPATGRPTDGPIRSATAWAPSAAEANTWSTAALVWGASARRRLALAGVDARLVDRSGSVHRIGAWPEEVPAA